VRCSSRPGMNRDGSRPSPRSPCAHTLAPTAPPSSVRVALAALVAKALPREEDPFPRVLGRELGLLLGRDDGRQVRPGDERQRGERGVFQVEVLRAGEMAAGRDRRQRLVVCQRKLVWQPMSRRRGSTRLRLRESGRTTSPSSTTFSPRTRNTPRSVCAYALVAGWYSRSIVCVRTRLAEAG